MVIRIYTTVNLTIATLLLSDLDGTEPEPHAFVRTPTIAIRMDHHPLIWRTFSFFTMESFLLPFWNQYFSL